MSYDQTNGTQNLAPGADKKVMLFLVHPLLDQKNPYYFLILVLT